jgi:nickel transport protein
MSLKPRGKKMQNVFKPLYSTRLSPWAFLLSWVAILSWAPPVMAHKTIVFAWIEGDTVYTQSKFAGGRKAKNALVEVLDSQGNRLTAGKTDEKGAFSFKAPAKSDMKIVVSAGTGHRGEWMVSAGEFEVGQPPLQTSPQKTPAEKKMIAEPQIVSDPLPGEIQAAVEKALDKKLKPVLKMLAESRNQGPEIRDIFGGIGYILGLVGLGAYIHYRKKRTDRIADDA